MKSESVRHIICDRPNNVSVVSDAGYMCDDIATKVLAYELLHAVQEFYGHPATDMTVTILGRGEHTKIYDDYSVVGAISASGALVVAAAKGTVRPKHRIGAWVNRTDGSQLA